MRQGGVWAEGESLDALLWVSESEGYLWSGLEGQRLEPLPWLALSVDGGEMRAMAPHGVLWGRARWPQGEGPHPVVIWLARDGGTLDDHPEAADALAAAGFFVLSYDRRGVGNSRLWEDEELSLERHAADIDDWIPFLEQHPMADHESVSLLGHGIGGRIAQLRNEDSFTISGPGADRTANPDLDAREPWRAGDNARGLTPGSLVRIGALLR